ncbi:cyclic pyranopterin phosphate synthase [Acetoanaerobium pronyense]|uniref:cyclic pyranopterin monophosphate synthase n=1 Tax=Acetoanaerobium pronyense TaxID=1482736 RepID=A0ABS4KGD5_9FIRM|nr:cyclic pyranopterin monophosphate synthase MoaC [Acetoanaerobium pronyense]MBP2026825.1 cyclic pyranopterin phosphate synthase [Acetoanaerobium pronyense]
MLTHIKENVGAVMVDVGEKKETTREAIAEAEIFVGKEIIKAIKEYKVKKGDVIAVAQVAGIMASKKTWDLIPMCHNINLSGCEIDFETKDESIKIYSIVRCQGKTGVEMEALTSVSIAALTIYDMVKSISKDMEIKYIRLNEKKGGKSGHYQRGEL